MRVIVCKDYNELSLTGAKLIASQLMLKPNTVLGLATGSTPIGIYNELVSMYNNNEIDFKNVTTFNLDEYYPISHENDQSYHYFMNKYLFSKVNIPTDRIHIPSGEAQDTDAECSGYDKLIESAGGIDLQLLGIGNNGHIGFNEPDENLETGTHITHLTQSTIEANSRFFNDISEVPTKAITMGIATILKSRKIIIAANGTGKHEAVEALLTNDINTMIPATMLKVHPDVVLICDEEAYKGGK